MATDRTLAHHIAATLEAIENCESWPRNALWLGNHKRRLAVLVRQYMPRGSGIDNGTTLDDSSHPGRLVFVASFHHMNADGFYCGWSDYRITVRPSFVHVFEIRVTGRDSGDADGMRDYMADTFRAALESVIPDSEWCELCAGEDNTPQAAE